MSSACSVSYSQDSQKKSYWKQLL